MRAIALIVVGAMAACALPCSIFYVYDGKHALAGDSEDWIDPNTQVWFVPKTATTYGVVYFGFGKGDYPDGGIRRALKGRELPEGGVINIEPSDAYGFPQAGMNDKGLFFGGAATDTVKTTNDKPKFDGFFADYVMRHCATVPEALKVIEQYDVGMSQGQILLGDRFGNSAVIEPGNKVLPGNGKYQIITNFRLSATRNVSCPRYKKLDAALTACDNLTVPFARDAIASVGRGPTRDSLEKKVPGTQYSVVFDLTNGVAHLYNRFDFRRAVQIDVKKETSGTPRAVTMAELFR